MGKSKKFNTSDATAYAAMSSHDAERQRRIAALREAADARRNAAIAARKARREQQ
jgi:hypothetical protein